MKEFYEHVEKIVNKFNTNSIQYKVLHVIKENLIRLKDSVEIKRFELIRSFVSIELFDEYTREYVNIEITKSNMEIRGDGFEFFLFFDDKMFLSSYESLIYSFFKGEYTVLSFYNKNDKKEAFGIIWDKKELSNFDKERERISFIRNSIERKKKRNGNSLIT